MTGYQACPERMKTLPVIIARFKSGRFLRQFRSELVEMGAARRLTNALRFLNGTRRR